MGATFRSWSDRSAHTSSSHQSHFRAHSAHLAQNQTHPHTYSAHPTLLLAPGVLHPVPPPVSPLTQAPPHQLYSFQSRRHVLPHAPSFTHPNPSPTPQRSKSHKPTFSHIL